MRAVIVDDYGARPRLAGLPNPEVHAGQILIRADAGGINPMDRAIAAGDWQTRTPGKFPMVLGADVAGTVEQLGEGSKRLSVGEKVFGQLLMP